MNVLIISAANVAHSKEDSTSLKAASLISNIVRETSSEAFVETVALVDLALKPCIMCGHCYPSWCCTYDESYNNLLAKLITADVVFFVVPHYAPIPSKLSVVLEKIQEMCFIQMCIDNKTPYFLANKVVGVVVHGGSPKEYIESYKTNLLQPVAAALQGVGMKVQAAGENWPAGVAFGVTGFEKVPDSIFPRAIHDWDEILTTITPLVIKTLESAASLKTI